MRRSTPSHGVVDGSNTFCTPLVWFNLLGPAIACPDVIPTNRNEVRMGSFTTLQKELEGVILVVILVVIGLGILVRSGAGDHKRIMHQLTTVFLGMLVIGIAVSGKTIAVCDWAASFINT